MLPSNLALRSAKNARTCRSWASLPVEIRRTILEEVARQKHRGWASCAAVSTEWRDFIEPKNFRRLNLLPCCIGKLNEMVVRQRDLVQHICLIIELPRYTCQACNQEESLICTSLHRSIVHEAMKKLFPALSTWQPTGRLTLELNAYSPSDSEHWFKNYHFGLDNESLFQPQQDAAIWHDPKHGWVSGKQVQQPPPSLPRDLSAAHAVTGLVIRRQLRRQIAPEPLGFISERLPRLETLLYEPWLPKREGLATYYLDMLLPRPRTALVFSNAAIAFLYILEHRLPPDLKTVSIFKNANEHVASAVRSSPPQLHDSDDPMAHQRLVEAFVPKSSPRKEISALLHNASLATLNMPQLERMVLWFGETGEACAVIYHRNKASRLSHDMVESWEKVTPDAYYLWIEVERIQGVDIHSRGDAIHHLRLPEGIIGPVSLWQMRHENASRIMA
ncbi:uncharacterized protein B0T15DRAFT_484552 [Chaetomium strumarium]|uniref:DUF6546 domain-containing protein n=1 Tax=Chaetomium strumarium TaxID=1170767 RepID=A0AAJ0M3J3_9PEZI|nr:hypothetical protein B0T15DRAFT_484552 [Chaetomium strumarium]